MSSRASVLQKTQIKPEATPGVAVPADLILSCLSLTATSTFENEQFRPEGSKFDTANIPLKSFTTLGLDGVLDYDEIGYVLASAISRPVTTANLDGTYTHVFTPSTSEADAPVSFTVEKGDAIRAERITYCMFDSVAFDISRKGAKVSGGGWGRLGVDGIVRTPNAVQSDAKPVIPGNFSFFVAREPAIGSLVKASGNYGNKFGISGARAAEYVVDAENTGFVSTVDLAPEATGSALVQTNTEGMAFLNDIAEGSAVYTRQEANGRAIGTGVRTQKFCIDASHHVTQAGQKSDVDGIYAIEWSFKVRHDATRGFAYQITLVNTTPSYVV